MSGSDGDSPDKTGSVADTESWLNPTGADGKMPATPSMHDYKRDARTDLSETGAANAESARSVTVSTHLEPDSSDPGQILQIPESARLVRIRNMSTTPKDDRSFIRGRLIVVSEEDHGVYSYLDGPLLTLGRARDADIMILDEGASRLHARLVRHEEGFRIIDAESGNGTYLNGRSVKEAELYDGDVIGIGQTRLQYESLGWRRRLIDRPSVVQAVFIGHPATESGLRQVWPKLLTAALTAFLTIMVFTLLEKPDALDSAAIASTWYERAQGSARDARWRDARDELEVARVLGLPEARYAPMVETVETNMRDLELVRMIETSIVSGQPIVTIQTLASQVNPKGAHAPTVAALIREAVKARTNRWIRDARRAMAAADDDTARILLNKTLEAKPGFPQAKTMLQALDRINSPTPRARSKGPKQHQ